MSDESDFSLPAQESLRAQFERLLGLPEAARAGWLAQANLAPDRCAQLLELLAADAQSPTDFVAKTRAQLQAILVAAPGLDATPEPSDAAPSAPEERQDALLQQQFGPYLLTQWLGRGGMASVYVGSRNDGKFAQEVAVKVLRQALQSEFERRLFQREQQALAALDHPNVARLFDGGVTEAGLPYLVMELVRGKTLLEHCQTQGLSLRARVALFAQVCDGVQAAHRALIVHRDIKPGNIVVSAAGVPKLLDFGVAKILRIDADSAQTQTYAPLTPAYAAPEQFDGGTITTATDVYSLGMVLHELLTGERRKPGDTTRASELLKRMQANANSETVRFLQGDIDNILRQAMAAEAGERYASAGDLAADIRRYLEGQPVLAHPPSGWYRMGKFLRRNRGAVALSSLLLMGLLGSLAYAIDQARIARAQADRATAVLGFVEGLFESVDPAIAKTRELSAREILDRGANDVGREFPGQPAIRAQLNATLGRLYLKLGDLKSATLQLDAALTLTPSSEAQLRFWRLLDRTQVDIAASATKAGLARWREAFALLGKLDSDPRANVALLSAHAELIHQAGDSIKALTDAKEAHRMSVELLRDSDPIAIDAAITYVEILGTAGRDREALPIVGALAVRSAANYGDTDPRTLNAQSSLADVLSDVDQLSEAQVIAQTVMNQRLKVLDEKHPAIARSHFQLGELSAQAGDYKSADQHFAQAISLLRGKQPGDRNLLAKAVYALGTSQYFQGNLELAQQAYRESAELWRAEYGLEHRDVLQAELALAQVLRRLGNLQEALQIMRRVVQVNEKLGSDLPETADALRIYGSALSSNQQHVEAINMLERAVAMTLRLYGETHEMPHQTRVLLGRAYLNAGRMVDAATVTATALSAFERIHPNGHRDVARTQAFLAAIELKRGNLISAEALARKQFVFFRGHYPEPDSVPVAQAQGLLGACLLTLKRIEEGRALLLPAIMVLKAREPADPQIEIWEALLNPMREN
jgi:eukaryotic-like serine/threonine-protein kinase